MEKLLQLLSEIRPEKAVPLIWIVAVSVWKHSISRMRSMRQTSRARSYSRERYIILLRSTVFLLKNKI